MVAARDVVRSAQRRGNRAAFGAAELLVPSVAGRWAERLFFRVPAPPSLERRSRGFRPGTPVTVDLDGRAVRGTTWGATDAPRAYLVHGWGGWWQQLGVYVEPLVAAGLRVVAYDAPSHGASDPGIDGAGRSRIPELAAALQAVMQACGPARAVIAHSGGAMAAMEAIRLGVAVDRVVFVAASVRVEDMVDTFRAQWGIGPRTAAEMLRRSERRVGRPMSSFDAESIARELDELPRALIVHDRDDRETPARGSERLARAWPDAELLVTRGLGHARVLWAPEVVQAVVAFLATGTRRDGD